VVSALPAFSFPPELAVWLAASVEAQPVSPLQADVAVVQVPDVVVAEEPTASVEPLAADSVALPVADLVAEQAWPVRADWAAPQADEPELQPDGLVPGGCWPELLPADFLAYWLEQLAADSPVALPQVQEQAEPVVLPEQVAPDVRLEQVAPVALRVEPVVPA
jgi:hypothetical protein